MARRSLVHPRVTRAVGAEIWPHRITVLERIEGQDEIGQPIDAWAALDDLIDLPSRIGSARVAVQRQPTQTPTITTMVAVLRDWYPGIVPGMRIIDQDDITYDILGRTWDSVKLTSHLDIQEVRDVA